MSTLVLMQKDGLGQMNVPNEKVEAFKVDGWIVIDRPIQPAPIIETQPIDPQAKSPASYFGTKEERETESSEQKADEQKTEGKKSRRQ